MIMPSDMLPIKLIGPFWMTISIKAVRGMKIMMHAGISANAKAMCRSLRKTTKVTKARAASNWLVAPKSGHTAFHAGMMLPSGAVNVANTAMLGSSRTRKVPI